jgi:hypothetical protein
MKKIEIFDPAMCCSTGVCGPGVDAKLIEFAADLDWLKGRGVVVERYNLAQQPDKFVSSEAVSTAMTLAGDLCLPLILIDGKIVSRNVYPDRDELAALTGLDSA